MAETIKKKRKNEPDGFDRFNRVSNKANVLLNLMLDRKSTRLNSSHSRLSRMPSSA